MEDNRTDPYRTAKADAERPEAGAGDAVGTIPTTEPMNRLARKVMDEFRVNSLHRQQSGVDAMLEYADQAGRLRYSARQMDTLRACGIDPRNYRPLTQMKVRAARAMLTDIIKQSGDKPYTLAPTPKPTIPKSAEKRIMEDMAQEIVRFFQKSGGALDDERQAAAFYVSVVIRVSEMYDDVRRREFDWAKSRCERMDQKIHDQLVEGGFVDAFNRLVGYVCQYGTGVMVGPCPKVMPTRSCRERETSAGPVTKYVLDYEVRPVYEAVSPWDCYPAPNAKSVQDGTLCVKVRYTAASLWQYAEAMADRKDAPDGWQPETVRALLSRYPNGGVRLDLETYDYVRRDLERNSISGENDCTLEGIRCFGSFRGSDLIVFGLDKTPDGQKVVPNRYYKAETIVIAGYVVFCSIIDDRMQMPIVKANLYESPDCWWGDTVADILYSAQSLQNNALKNIIQNGALSSNGMYVCQDVQNVVSLDGTPALSLRAGKMFGFKRGMNGGAGVPISVLQVQDTTQNQLNLLRAASQMADDDCGIPQYTIGSSQQLTGAGRTASGLAMMSEAACRVINMCICDLGRNVIVPVVKMTHVYNLLNDDDMSIKGDVDVNPSGLMGKILREAESQRRQQVTAMLGQHPILSKAITVEGFFELIRPELENIGVNVDKIIPSKERMETYQMIMDAAQAQQAMAQERNPDAGSPTPEQANVARVEGQPGGVAAGQGSPAPGSVAERRSVA